MLSLLAVVQSQVDLNDLVNQNSPPTKDGKKFVFAPEFNKSEHTRVFDVLRSVVKQMDDDQFWACVKNLDDTRFCTTLQNSNGGGRRNYSIGEISQLIVEETICRGYMRHFKGDIPHYLKMRGLLFQPKQNETRIGKLKSWLKDNHGLKLFEIQALACDLAISKLNSEPTSPQISNSIERIEQSKTILHEKGEFFRPNLFFADDYRLMGP